MKFKDIYKEGYPPVWRMTDPEPEFATCERCRAEVPVYVWRESGRELCWICSNAPFSDSKEITAAIFAVNMALRMAGGFDEVEVVDDETGEPVLGVGKED